MYKNFVDSRSTGSSFIDPSISFHILDENDEDYVPTYLTQDQIEGTLRAHAQTLSATLNAFSNTTSSCLNDERWLEFTTILMDTATVARLF